MARTLVQIRREMEKLQKEGERVRAAEVAGVIAKIRTAIDFYGLTSNDLFAATSMKVTKVAHTLATQKESKLKKAPSRPKYKDLETGKTWTGHGMRPGWFVRAIESGKKSEEMAI